MPSSERLLISNATLVSMDPEIGNRRRASILVEGGRIAAVGEDPAAEAAAVIEAEGLIAIPGLVDAHRHVWQSPLAMVAADLDLGGYFAAVPGRLAPVFAPEDLRVANRIGALQALDAGVTTLFDWCHVLHTPAHVDAAVEGLRESGIRAVFAYGFPNTEPAWSMDSDRPVPGDVRRVRRDLLPSAEGLVTMAMALRGPEQSTLEVTGHDLAVARDLGLRASLHVGNGAFGLPYRSIERMDALGLLGPDLQYVHGNSLTDESLRRIAETGGCLVSTPSVELQMQFGYPAATRFLAAGGRPALGVDVVTSTGFGLFDQMRGAFRAARLQALETGTPDLATADVLGFATLGCAAAVGLEQAVGSLAPGKQADIVLLRPGPLVPANDPVGYTVLQATAAEVDTVLVGGRVRKRAGALVGIDLQAERAALLACRDRLFARSGFRAPISAFR